MTDALQRGAKKEQARLGLQGAASLVNGGSRVVTGTVSIDRIGTHGKALVEAMRLRKYSNATIKLYLHFNRDFVIKTGIQPEIAQRQDIERYILILEESGDTASTINSAISALKFYYGAVLKSNIADIPKRPKKEKRLPDVLSKNEVRKILTAADNIKHKLLLTLVYSAGLRVSEAVALKPSDINMERNLIFVNVANTRNVYEKCQAVYPIFFLFMKKISWQPLFMPTFCVCF
ncbi:MAG: tyrosine-type recombinase/integrase, partial [Spirochaetaceae bacterium]|nr:tyrosine-type recombinase/integrase [Spirochaetaceae bacterium]